MTTMTTSTGAASIYSNDLSLSNSVFLYAKGFVMPNLCNFSASTCSVPLL